MQLNTDFKLAGPLAGLFGGITQAQEQERQGLANAYQGLKNQEQQYTSAEAQAKLQDPQYIQMKLQNDMSKFGKETSINEIESAYNKANIAVAHLKAAEAQGPQALQQAALGYLQEMRIDPNSEKGQMLLKDPVGSAEKLSQFYGIAATNNPEYMRQYGLQEQKGQWDMKKQESANASHERTAAMSANASIRSAELTAGGRDTTALLTAENNLRQRIAQMDNTIEHYARGDADAEIIASIRKQDPKKTEAQAKSEAKQQREETVRQLREDRKALSQRADQIGEASTGRLKLGQKPPEGSPELPPGVTRK